MARQPASSTEWPAPPLARRRRVYRQTQERRPAARAETGRDAQACGRLLEALLHRRLRGFRVSTNVPGSVRGRALGTILDPKGKAIGNINKGEAFYGEVDILGKAYVTGYDPIKDASGKVIGIWYVGYEK